MKEATARAIVEAAKEFGGLNDNFLELDEAYCPNMGKPTAAVIGPLTWLLPAVAAAAIENGQEFVEDLERLHFYTPMPSSTTPTSVIVY
jgi:hypothetical protein